MAIDVIVKGLPQALLFGFQKGNSTRQRRDHGGGTGLAETGFLKTVAFALQVGFHRGQALKQGTQLAHLGRLRLPGTGLGEHPEASNGQRIHRIVLGLDPQALGNVLQGVGVDDRHYQARVVQRMGQRFMIGAGGLHHRVQLFGSSARLVLAPGDGGLKTLWRIRHLLLALVERVGLQQHDDIQLLFTHVNTDENNRLHSSFPCAG
jgi:hypothetical protein